MNECLSFLNGIGETLRYFYSAVFQGFAAIITLGSMYYLYYKQNLTNELNIINEKIRADYNNHLDEIFEKQEKKFLEERINSRPQVDTDFGLNKNKNYLERIKFINKKVNEIEIEIPKLLKQTIYILILSLIGLILCGLNFWLNVILFCFGIGLIIWIVIYLKYLSELITKMMK